MTAGSDYAGPDFEHAIIVRPLRCRRCGYDLRGLHVRSRCPECGFDTWTTIRHALDPAATRLPRLRNPRRVGDGLVWLVFCVLVAALLIVARPFALRLDSVVSAGGEIARWFPRLLAPMAAAMLLLALIAVAMLAPPPRQETGGAVWRDIWLMMAALLVWSVLALLFGIMFPLVENEILTGSGVRWRIFHAILGLLQLLSATALLWALRGVLEVIGERSREYRTARGGRQRIRDMIAAAVGLGLGQLTVLAGLVWERPWLQTLGTVAVWVTMLMLLIGAVYLLMNAWWIRSALRRPPVTLEELVTPEAGRGGEGEAGRPGEGEPE